MPIWADSVDPAVLRARCIPASEGDLLAIDLRRLPITIAAGDDGEHIRWDVVGGPVRLDVVEGRALDGAVRIEPAIALDRALEPQFGAVRRIRALLGGEVCEPAADPRLPRLILALRAIDARSEGASLREIAIGLLGEDDWPGDGEWMKSWARRVVTLAVMLNCAGPRGVLAGAI